MSTDVYRWRGVARNGAQRSGRTTIDDLPAWVELRFGQGWRALTVCAGDGPVPPPAIGPSDVVARIGPHPDHGRRTWWAETQPDGDG
jgi:hypothetical protein